MRLSLFLPESPTCAVGKELLNWLDQERLGEAVEVVYRPVDVHLADQVALFGVATDQSPYLEVLVGDEMACMFHYCGSEVLSKLREHLGSRLPRPKRITQRLFSSPEARQT